MFCVNRATNLKEKIVKPSQIKSELQEIQKNRYKNFQIYFSKKKEDLKEYYQIREQCYRRVPDGPKDFDGSEDMFDRMSDIMIVRANNQIIGGARIYGRTNKNDPNLPLEEDGFLLKNLFPDKQLDRVSYCEFGRMAVLEQFRSKVLLKTIVVNLCQMSIARGYKYLFTMSPLQQARCYRMIINEIDFPHKYNIYRDIELPQKSEKIGGVLKMQLSSLKFPKTWENDNSKNQPLIYLQNNRICAGDENNENNEKKKFYL